MKIRLSWPRGLAGTWWRDIEIADEPGDVVVTMDGAGEVRVTRNDVAEIPAVHAEWPPPGLAEKRIRNMIKRIKAVERAVAGPNGHGDAIVDLANDVRRLHDAHDRLAKSHAETVERVKMIERERPSTGFRLPAPWHSGAVPTLADLTANAGPVGLTPSAQYVADYRLPSNWPGQTAEIHEAEMPREAVYVNELGELLPGACGNSRAVDHSGARAKFACTRPANHPMTLHIGRSANGQHLGEWDANEGDARGVFAFNSAAPRGLRIGNTYIPDMVNEINPPCNHPPCGHRAAEHVGDHSRSGLTGCVHLEPRSGTDENVPAVSCPCARSREEVLHQAPTTEEKA